LLNVFRWIADPSHAKIDGDFPHSYGILIAVPHIRGSPIGKGRAAPKEELKESGAYRPHLNQAGEKDRGISRHLGKLVEFRIKEIQARKVQG
jgi:hypothetical protein